MKKILPRSLLTSALVGALFVAGCATPPKPAPVAATPAPASVVKPPDAAATAQSVLNEGISLYEKGDYNAALKRLAAANELANDNKAIQLTSLKYMAFSYCVTSRPTLCRHQFEKAFKINPAFDLAPGEKGHPLWGPVFERAKKSR
jgi:Tfp pilus assembly protein PilF